MKTSTLTRTLTAAAAGAAILAGSLLIAAPASADSSNRGGLGTVCTDAAPGTTLRVAMTGATANTPRTYADAIAAQKKLTPDNAAALTAQRDRNVAAGLTSPATLSGDRIVFAAITNADGCVSVPSTGAAASSVTVALGSTTATATYAPTVAFDRATGTFAWSDASTVSSSKIEAPARTFTHGEAIGGTVGFDLNVVR